MRTTYFGVIPCKSRATKDQWEHIQDLTFHDLRHDFAHRAREAGWSLEEVAYYLGHITKKGTLAIQTTNSALHSGKSRTSEREIETREGVEMRL